MRQTLISLIAVAMLIASAAQASRAPTGGDSKAIASVALPRAPLRVSQTVVATAKAVKPRLRVVPRTVTLGGRITLVGRGFRRNASVWLGVGPPQSEATRVGSARTDGRGAFRKTLNPRRHTGRWVAIACQRGCRIKAGATFRIVGRIAARG
jgi:hypothetical protein